MEEPCCVIIFGATGNLATTKLLPALYHLEAAGRLHPETVVLGFGRRDWDDSEWRKLVRALLEPRVRGGVDEQVAGRLLQRLRFQRGDLQDASAFVALAQSLRSPDGPPLNRVFYMAIGPDHYAQVAANLGAVGLSQEHQGWSRLVVEKPFGFDLESSQILDQALHRHFREDQIFRIDHYLGKSTVQNVLVFRFANLML